ncbi:hypothetical protein [Roseateles koreensis]|uniref:Uncharacterized protein n=1 Tax=Roseateles koreensis TaxID=2987526 RepID=A0ABT5KM55_9BURK|nr:hypothetical protein [Roseateles koreensis]MDC8783931.1 hypothetical protein [Roseateles koreensis]
MSFNATNCHRVIQGLGLMMVVLAVKAGPVLKDMPRGESPAAPGPLEMEAQEPILPPGLNMVPAMRPARSSHAESSATSVSSASVAGRAPPANSAGRTASAPSAASAPLVDRNAHAPDMAAEGSLRETVKGMLSEDQRETLKGLRDELGQIKNSLILENPEGRNAENNAEKKRITYEGEGKFAVDAGGQGAGGSAGSSASRFSNGQASAMAVQLAYELLPWALGAVGLYAVGSGLMSMLRMQARRQQRRDSLRHSAYVSQSGHAMHDGRAGDAGSVGVAQRATAGFTEPVGVSARPHHSQASSSHRSSGSGSGRRMSSGRSRHGSRSGPYL